MDRIIFSTTYKKMGHFTPKTIFIGLIRIWKCLPHVGKGIQNEESMAEWINRVLLGEFCCREARRCGKVECSTVLERFVNDYPKVTGCPTVEVTSIMLGEMEGFRIRKKRVI